MFFCGEICHFIQCSNVHVRKNSWLGQMSDLHMPLFYLQSYGDTERFSIVFHVTALISAWLIHQTVLDAAPGLWAWWLVEYFETQNTQHLNWLCYRLLLAEYHLIADRNYDAYEIFAQHWTPVITSFLDIDHSLQTWWEWNLQLKMPSILQIWLKYWLSIHMCGAL